MLRKFVYAALLPFFYVASASCAHSAELLRFIDSYSLESDYQHEGRKFGGISGLAWNEKSGVCYAVTDNNSHVEHSPPTLFVLAIKVTDKGISQVTVTHHFTLRDAGNEPLPEGSTDVEGLTLVPDKSALLFSAEIGPPLWLSDLHGTMLRGISDIIPEKFNAQGKHDEHHGVRHRESWEGVTFSPSGRFLFLAVESSLKQDGPGATPLNSGTSRLIQFSVSEDLAQITPLNEFLYITDPVPIVTATGINDNGVVDVLALDDTRLLVLERSGRNVSDETDDKEFNIRLYLADVSTATNIAGIPSLAQAPDKARIQSVRKQLLIDFSHYLNMSQERIESVTFGPRLNGAKTLLFATDNNLQPEKATRFFLFKDIRGILE